MGKTIPPITATSDRIPQQMKAQIVVRQAAVLACLIAGIVVPVSEVYAAASYTFNHFIDTYNSSTLADNNVGTQGTPINYSFDYQSVDHLDRNFGEVHGHVQPGSIGITASAYNVGVYAPQRQEVFATSEFDVVFSSPQADPINVILNMDLSGEISPPSGYSRVSVAAGPVGKPASRGNYYKTGNPGPGSPEVIAEYILAGFSDDGAKHEISTIAYTVPVNVPVRMTMTLSTVQGYDTSNPTISFGHTLSLAGSGDVFTVLGGNAASISINSIDAGIINNQFSAVPVPPLLPLVVVSLVGLLTRRRVQD